MSSNELSVRLERLLEQHRKDRKDLVAVFVGFAPDNVRHASKATVNRWFTGRSIPSLPQAHEIARFFGCSIDYLADPSLKSGPEYGVALDETQKNLLWLADKVGIEEAIKRILMVPS
jgi:transcriptional regulator with XRE-family HTH domain